MSLKQIDLTTALRPSLLPDEVLLFVQDNVGLYEGYDLCTIKRPVEQTDTAIENTKYQTFRMVMHT